MYIYRLRHIYDNADYDLPAPLTLGYFSEPSKANEAIEHYRTLPGFQDYPNGFIIEECALGAVDSMPQVVYEAYFSFSDEEKIYDYSGEIGVYTSEQDAKKAVSNFKRMNRNNIMKSILNQEIECYSYEINKQEGEWCKTGDGSVIDPS
ncbi:MAG: hypothetical protein IKD31_03190 [Clostridia bacterium]|nr:hypothetical protein [Clostridia bacterium]